MPNTSTLFVGASRETSRPDAMAKPVSRSRQAQQDIVETIDYYKAVASAEVALRFVEALEDASVHISEFPAAGSPRFWERQGLSGLRSRQIRDFPHLIFYVEEADRIVIWRVLHAARNLSARLSEQLQDESE